MQRFTGGVIAWHPDIGGAFEVHGAILERWRAVGDVRFGFPITDESTPPPVSGAGIFPAPSPGRYNHFRAVHLAGKPDSSIYWHPDLGAHEIYGAIREKWASLGWERSVVGYPVGAEAPVHGGAVQSFQFGFIAWHPSIGAGRDGAHEVHGSIGARWNALGETDFGFPITDELTPLETVGVFDLPSRGRYNHFRAVHLEGTPESSIYWHPDVAGGAHEIFGAIREKWASLGWERNVVGYPTDAEAPVHGGAVQPFQFGFIAWHPSIGAGRDGAHEVHGSIGARWNALGETDFGFPITDELSTPGESNAVFTFPSEGRFNHFRAVHLPDTPESSIYWHPDVAGGAHEVYGAIRDKWASLGWERSKLGYPTSGERDRRGVGRTQDFQNGAIAWVPGPGAWVDWFRVQRRIITPEGTALSGFAELEVHHNGHTFFRGHLHNSSDIVDYKVLVRATLDIPPPLIRPPAGSAGQAVVFQQSGEVENNFNWFDSQYHPLIQASWGEVERATVGIAKSYEKTGLIDDIGQLALDSISFVLTSATVGGHIAVALLIAKGLSSVTKTPIGALGGDLGILAVAGTTLLLGPTFAIPVFIGAVAYTALRYDHRSIRADEYEFAKVVFGETLPDRENIILTNMNGLGGAGFTMPGMDGRSVVINITDDAFNYPGGPMRYPSDAYPIPGQLLIHELVHAWQFHHMGRFVPGYVCRGVGAQIGNIPPGSAYRPPAAGSKWGSDFGMEQEAATVDLWFGRHAFRLDAMNNKVPWSTLAELRDMLNSQPARDDRYFRYIENNIRLGEDDHD